MVKGSFAEVAMKRMFVVAALGLVFLAAAQAQDMMRGAAKTRPQG